MGALTTGRPSAFPNTFYRVSVKALIRDISGKVLVLKEYQNTWSLPGGGLDHGEDPIVGLKREIKEELGIEVTAKVAPLCVKVFYLESKQTWLMWVVFLAEADPQDFVLGDGVTAAEFIDPAELKHSTDIFEKLAYEVANESQKYS